MRLLVCNWKDIRHPDAGGAEVYTHEVARAWVKDGHEVTLFSSQVAEQEEEEEHDGIRVIRRGSRLGVYRAAGSFIARHSAEFDLIIDEVNTRPFFCHTRARDTPVVALIHQVAREIWFEEQPLPIAAAGRYVLEPMWLRRLRAIPVLTVSESSRRSLLPFGFERIEVVPEGLTLPEGATPSTKNSRPTVVFAGRLSASKRPQHAIAAMALAARSIPDLQGWVIGKGPMYSRLARRLPKCVRLLGPVTEHEKYQRFAAAHALVVTSVREGWGLVVSEAAAVGTRTIGYRVPGLVDSVAATGGVLVGEDPDEMAACIVSTLQADPVPPIGTGTLPWKTVAKEVLASAAASVGAASPVPARLCSTPATEHDRQLAWRNDSSEWHWDR